MPNHNHNALLTPYQLGDLNLRNRIVMAPLTRTRAENAGHIPNDLMVEYYAQRASAGLIITEGTWVSEEAQGWYGVPGIYNEEQAQAWRRVTDAVHARGGRIFVQLWHQGGVSHPSVYPDSRQPVAPSAINPEQLVNIRGGQVMSGVPRAMSKEDIRRTVADFKNASRLPLDAGFDGIQLQAGYVYLFNQFLHDWPVRDILWMFHFDVIHHRGQLSSYLRPMGAIVPSIYGKSGDENGGGEVVQTAR